MTAAFEPIDADCIAPNRLRFQRMPNRRALVDDPDAKAAGVRHCRGELGEPDVVHAALDDRVLDPEELSDPGFHAGDSIVRATSRSLPV